ECSPPVGTAALSAFRRADLVSRLHMSFSTQKPSVPCPANRALLWCRLLAKGFAPRRSWECHAESSFLGSCSLALSCRGNSHGCRSDDPRGSTDDYAAHCLGLRPSRQACRGATRRSGKRSDWR